MVNLREWVKSSLIFPDDLRKRLLETDWQEDLEDQIRDLYKKYWLKEKKIINELNVKMTDFYIEWVRNLEKEIREKEKSEISKLEKIIDEEV